MRTPGADEGVRADNDATSCWSDALSLDVESNRVVDLASDLEFLRSGSFVNPLFYSSQPAFLQQLDLVAAELGVSSESPAWQVLLSITVNLVRNWHRGRPSVVSLRRGDHPTPARYLMPWWREDTVRKVICDLFRRGFVLKVPGSKKTRQATRIWPTPKLVSLLPADVPQVERWPDPELLELRVPRDVLDDDDDQDDRVKLLAYRDHPRLDAMRHRLEQVNALLLETRIGLLPGHGLPPEEVDAFTSAPHTLRRIFNGKWTLGGRHYTRGSWQTLRRKARRYLCINGSQTVEVDFAGLHIAMAYALADIQLEGDPHAIPGVERLLAKRMGVIALNAKTRGKAICGFIKKVNDKRENGEWRDPELHACFVAAEPLSSTAIFEAIASHHHRIAQYIGSGVGLELQFRDSRIMSEILQRLSAKGIAALPVHDSVIVQVRHADLLEQLMLEEYEREMEFTIEVKRKYGLRRSPGRRFPAILHSRPGRSLRQP